MVDIIEESKILIFFKLQITPISERNFVDLRPFFESGDAEIGGYGLISIFENLDLSLSCIDTAKYS